MGKTIVITNRKGGTGKSATCANLGIGLARQGKSVLILDADSQSSLSISLGVLEPDKLPLTLATVMSNIINETEFNPTDGIIRHTEGVDLMPANNSLARMEIELASLLVGRETVLRQYIEMVKPLYDYVIVDTAPTLGLLTVNALAAADSVIIPVTPKFLDAKGLELLLKTISQIRLENNWDVLTPQKAETLWNKAVEELPEFRTSNLHLIGGTVLPVWDKLPTENVRIYRVLTTDGDLLIGRVIPEDLIDATLYKMDASRTKERIETADLLKHIKNGDTVYLDNDWRIVQKRVSNEQRIEVIGADYLHSDLLAKKGLFTERIAYQTRYFIPAEKDTIKILDDVFQIAPVSRIAKNNERTAVKSGVAMGRPSLLNAVERNAEKSRLMFGSDAGARKCNAVAFY